MGEHLRERFRRPGPKRVLALDGGGARGLLTLGVLQKLEDELGRRSGHPGTFRLAHYFDLIGGTSTGSIIATTLALEWKVRDIVALYFDLLPSIFARPQASGFWRLTKPAYKNTALTKALAETLDDRSLGDESLKTGLAIHAKRIDTGSAWVLVNNPDWRYFDKTPGGDGIGNGDLRLRDLVQASAAAPTYFLPVEVSIGPRHGNKKVVATLVDGGVSPNNNPALQMLTTATDPAFGFQWATGEQNLLLWSIGTGYVRKQFRKPDRKRRSSALPMSKFKAYSSKVQAALEGYNHDISQQHITIMQALSRPRFPWYINSEIRSQTESPLLSGAPALCYQRYDARIEIDNANMRRPEHIEELVGREMKAAEVAKLREMDISDPELLDTLYRAGEALGAAQLIHRDTREDHDPVRAAALAPDWPPTHFDLPMWQSAPAMETARDKPGAAGAPPAV